MRDNRHSHSLVTTIVTGVLFFYSLSLKARPLILVIEARTQTSRFTHDPMQEQILSELLKASGVAANLKTIRMDHFQNLAKQLKNIPKKGDVISGIILLGHGNKDVFETSEQVLITAPEMASVIYDALKDKPLSQNLLLYFNSCENGAPSDSFTNFSEVLAKELYNRIDASFPLKAVQIVSHVAETYHLELGGGRTKSSAAKSRGALVPDNSTNMLQQWLASHDISRNLTYRAKFQFSVAALLLIAFPILAAGSAYEFLSFADNLRSAGLRPLEAGGLYLGAMGVLTTLAAYLDMSHANPYLARQIVIDSQGVHDRYLNAYQLLKEGLKESCLSAMGTL